MDKVLTMYVHKRNSFTARWVLNADDSTRKAHIKKSILNPYPVVVPFKKRR